MTTIHATEYGRHQGWVDKHPQTYIHGVERWITNRSQRVIACSHYMREQIVDIFGVEETRISVIPNGIDPDDLPAQDPADLARLRAEFAAPEEKLVLLIGRLVYEKGFQLALEAMPRVIEEAPGTRFLVAGSGTHEAELRRQAQELGLMEHGTFLGWIGDDVLHSLYRIADLTVVPSIYEPFGLVALEAMASGCPCIVADTGGLREVVPHEEAGLRFRSRDPEALGEVARPRALRRRRSAVAWSPKPTSTCAASTGPTSPSRPPPSTPTWSARLAPPERLPARRLAAAALADPEPADPGPPGTQSRPSSSSPGGISRPPASLTRVSIRGSLIPRSSIPISVRCREARKPSSSWESCACARQRARFSPNRVGDLHLPHSAVTLHRHPFRWMWGVARVEIYCLSDKAVHSWYAPDRWWNLPNMAPFHHGAESEGSRGGEVGGGIGGDDGGHEDRRGARGAAGKAAAARAHPDLAAPSGARGTFAGFWKRRSGR